MPLDPQYWQWLNNEWNAGRLTRPGRALDMLRANPRQFLLKYPIQGNYDPQASGQAQVYLLNTGGAAQRPGSILGTHRMHTTESFTIQPSVGRSGDGHPFRVHGVYTGQSNLAPVWYLLDNNGPDIMLTAKLTGCTFIARQAANNVAGNVEVTHLQPNGETGLQLNTRMNIAGQETYGRLRYDISDRSINVIGVRVGTRWKIYAQKIDKHSMTIRSVHRIFPT